MTSFCLCFWSEIRLREEKLFVVEKVPIPLYVPVCYHSNENSQNTLTFIPVVFYSVSTAPHSETQDRYERLTSVSSSVDFEQRDNVKNLCRHGSSL